MIPGLCKVDNPSDYGIITCFKLDEYVKVLPTKENKLKEIYTGKIVWMEFDKKSDFKFLMKLVKLIQVS